MTAKIPFNKQGDSHNASDENTKEYFSRLEVWWPDELVGFRADGSDGGGGDHIWDQVLFYPKFRSEHEPPTHMTPRLLCTFSLLYWTPNSWLTLFLSDGGVCLLDWWKVMSHSCAELKIRWWWWRWCLGGVEQFGVLELKWTTKRQLIKPRDPELNLNHQCRTKKMEWKTHIRYVIIFM